MQLKFPDGRPEAGDRRWFQVKAATNDRLPEVFIYDEIGRGFFGGGLSAEDFVAEVKALNLGADQELLVRIDSPGGDMFDGYAIYNYLRMIKAKIIVRIDGWAASAASIVAMSGDRIEMPENTFQVLHNPYGCVCSDYRGFAKASRVFTELRDSAVKTYLRRAKDRVTESQLIEILDEETWLTAERCVELGFADVVDEPVRAAALARFDFNKYGFTHVPQLLADAKQKRISQNVQRREQLKLLKN
jgi:ATP-dependent protease ClpP protease subunit